VIAAIHAHASSLQGRLLIGLLAVTLAVFAGVCGHEFVHWDDNLNIYDNPNVAALGWGNIQWMFTDFHYARRYMPLGWLCYGAERQCFGLNPQAFHAVNLVFHLANVVLVFILLKCLLMRAVRDGESEGARDGVLWCAALGTLFWSINPLRVEIVAWASSVIYCVALFLALVSVLLWWHAQAPGLTRTRRHLLVSLSVVAYAASLLTYPVALFLPVVLFVLEVYPLRCARACLSDWLGRGAWHRWWDKVPFLLVSAGLLAVTLVARAGAPHFQPVSLTDFGVLPRVMQASYIWAYYAWKPWLPTDLAATYATLHAFNPLDAEFLLGMALVLGTTVLLVLKRKDWPVALGLWLCHLALLVPFLGLTEYPHSPYDRYSYLPGLLWSVGVSAILWRLWQHGRRAHLAAAVVAAASVLFGLLAWQQTLFWRDTITFYRHMIARLGEHPSRSRFDEVLGHHYLRAGLTNEAISSFESAITYEARRTDRHVYEEGVCARSHLVLGDLMLSQQRLADALVHYQAALKEESNTAGVVARIHAVITRIKHGEQASAAPPGISPAHAP
jgi:protein O-mannosyl-transferase